MVDPDQLGRRGDRTGAEHSGHQQTTGQRAGRFAVPRPIAVGPTDIPWRHRQCDRELGRRILKTKDFITDRAQLRQTADAGAAAVLLIVATIPPEALGTLFNAALDLGLEPLVEVHTEAELERALALSPTLIGINNRDILRLETDPGDVSVTAALAPRVPEGIVTVSESSLLTDENVSRALGAGTDAVLVGTMLLRSDDPAARLTALTQIQTA